MEHVVGGFPSSVGQFPIRREAVVVVWPAGGGRGGKPLPTWNKIFSGGKSQNRGGGGSPIWMFDKFGKKTIPFHLGRGGPHLDHLRGGHFTAGEMGKKNFSVWRFPFGSAVPKKKKITQAPAGFSPFVFPGPKFDWAFEGARHLRFRGKKKNFSGHVGARKSSGREILVFWRQRKKDFFSFNRPNWFVSSTLVTDTGGNGRQRGATKV